VTTCAAIVVAGSALTIAVRRADDPDLPPVAAPASPFVDLGSVDRLPPGSDAVLEAPGIFVLCAFDGMITAFSWRAPKEGCRIALASELAPWLDDRIVFHDPCHGQNFDRDGRPAGGPGIRGMYRYDVSTDVVSAAFTIDGVAGEIQIGPAGSWPDPVLSEPDSWTAPPGTTVVLDGRMRDVSP